MESRDTERLRDIANLLRMHSVRMTQASNSGHPTSCASMAEIMACLFFSKSGLRLHLGEPKSLANDKFVLSKGHAAPILYAAWAEAGIVSRESLLTLRKIDSVLEGHPTPRLPWIDVATGSLGQGICATAGMAYCSKYFEKSPQTAFFCLLGDGEMAEGSVWEAMNFASHYKLDNLAIIVDMNRLAQSEPTMFQHETHQMARRCEAFGFNAMVIDGHDIEQVSRALQTARDTREGRPHAIIAKTFKGKGFPAIEDKHGFHGKPLGGAADEILAKIEAGIMHKELLSPHAPSIPVNPPSDSAEFPPSSPFAAPPPAYKLGEVVATRNAFGTGLRAIGGDQRIVSVDADVQNSTMSATFGKEFPERQVQGYIAEQNAVGVATGVATRGRVAFVSTFAAFFTRAADFIRMCGISEVPVKYVGSHVGVSIGEDGTSQMGLEDLALFRAIPNAAVLYPSDAVSAERAVVLAANYPGIAYIRTTRGGTPVVYDTDAVFEIGKAQVLRSSDKDALTIVTGGITLPEALKAADALKAEGVAVRVVDLFSVKPVDAATLQKCATETNNKLLVVEDHYPEGGMRDAVSQALQGVTIGHLAVREIPHSGKPAELLAKFNLDSVAITAEVKKML